MAVASFDRNTTSVIKLEMSVVDVISFTVTSFYHTSVHMPYWSSSQLLLSTMIHLSRVQKRIPQC